MTTKKRELSAHQHSATLAQWTILGIVLIVVIFAGVQVFTGTSVSGEARHMKALNKDPKAMCSCSERGSSEEIVPCYDAFTVANKMRGEKMAVPMPAVASWETRAEMDGLRCVSKAFIKTQSRCGEMCEDVKMQAYDMAEKAVMACKEKVVRMCAG